jgi:phage terminase small subunit
MDYGEDGNIGPALRKLTGKQRRFVEIMVENVGILPSKAAELAGYKQSGWRLMQDQDVIAAIHEVAGRRLRAHALVGADVLVRLALDDGVAPAVRLKAAGTLLDRVGLGGEQNINVNHNHSDNTGKALEARARAAAGRLGMDPEEVVRRLFGVEAPKLIDVTPAEVKLGD